MRSDVFEEKEKEKEKMFPEIVYQTFFRKCRGKRKRKRKMFPEKSISNFFFSGNV